MTENSSSSSNLRDAVRNVVQRLLQPGSQVNAIGVELQDPADPASARPVIFISPSVAACDEAGILASAAPLKPAIVRSTPFEGLAGRGSAIASLDLQSYNIPPIAAGTFGATAVAGGKQYVLSANHVLAFNGRTKPGTGVFSPGPEDALNGGIPIGAYTGCVALAPPPAFNQADCAWAELSAAAPLPAGATPVQATPATFGMTVSQVGRTTGRQTGHIKYLDICASVDFSFGRFHFADQMATFDNAGTDPPFAQPGDSGALAVDAANPGNGIGLVYARSYIYAGNEFAGYVILICPLDQVISGMAGQGLAATIYSV
jgi:hypothetical protein